MKNRQPISRRKYRPIAVALLIVLLAYFVIMFSSCGNKQLIDTTYTYKTAIVKLPDGEVIKGSVDSWTDFEDGDQIQVKIDDKSYLVHSSNICLMTK